MRIYGDRISGNCNKVAFTADHLGLAYDWVDIDIMAGQSRTDRFLSLSPAGQVPVLELDDGRTLAQSNAIMLYLADGSDLVPSDPYPRAKLWEWLFWEQYSHEPYIAVLRFHMKYLGRPQAELDPMRVERGYAALAMMEQTLGQADFFVGDGLTVADIALVAYTRLAHEGGFELKKYPAVREWIGRVERRLGIA